MHSKNRYWKRSKSNALRFVPFLIALTLSGCSTAPSITLPTSEYQEKTNTNEQVVVPHDESTSQPESSTNKMSTINTQFNLKGNGSFVRPSILSSKSARNSSDGIALNFVEIDIPTAVTSVLGEAIGVPFSLDPTISGTLTLQSDRALSKEDALRALEVTLSLQGIAIVNGASGYAVVPQRTAQNQISELRTESNSGKPGYGVLAMPLEYVGSKELGDLLRTIAPQGHVLATDETRNLILLSGSSAELISMRNIVKQLDNDWMAGMSFALFTVKYVESKTIVDELNSILLDKYSPISSAIRLIPLTRLNAILVTSTSPTYLDKVGDWIARLDVGGNTAGRRIYVYDVQNERAEVLADSLSEIFGLGGGHESSTQSISATSTNTSLTQNESQSSTYTDESILNHDSRASLGFETLGIRIVPNSGSNSILILATADEFRVIESTLKRMDRPSLQVLIEATLAEVTLNDALKFGIQWESLDNGNIATLSQSSNGAVSRSFPGFSYLHTSNNFIATLNALDSITDVQVISSPRLMILNNQEATISIGDQVPILTQQAVSTDNNDSRVVNSVSQRDTGVILRVQPRVNSSGSVTLDIDQEVSSVVPTTSSGIDSPTIQERKISSTVSVRDGESIVLGGLISEGQSTGKSGVPFLSRIPLLGWLFGSTNISKQKTELIVFIRPRVIRDNQELKALTDDLRAEFNKTTQKFNSVTR